MTNALGKIEDKVREVLLIAADLARPLRARLTRAASNRERNRRLLLAYCVGLILSYVIITSVSGAPGFLLGGPGDFAAFYTAAHIIHSGNAHSLYDLSLQAQVQQALLAPHGWAFQDGLLPYPYPPVLALIFIPLSFLPLAWAFPAWNLINVALIFACVTLLLRHQRRHSSRDLVLASLVVFAFFPVFQALFVGQSSPLVLFALTLTYLALKSERDYLAGVTLGLGLVKPQFFLVIAAILLFRRRWRTVFAFGVTALVLLLISYAMVSMDGLLSYLDLIREMSTWNGVYGMDPTIMANVRGTVYRAGDLYHAWFGTELSPALLGTITLLLSLPVFAWLLYIWEGQWNPAPPEFELQFGLTVLAALLLSPHLHGHDLILLVLVGFLLLSFFTHSARSALARRMIAVGHVALLVLAFTMGSGAHAQAIAILLVSLMLILQRELKLRRISTKVQSGW
jgi:hypothetical protein